MIEASMNLYVFLAPPKLGTPSSEGTISRSRHFTEL
jgi:hypothetical protein